MKILISLILSVTTYAGEEIRTSSEVSDSQGDLVVFMNLNSYRKVDEPAAFSLLEVISIKRKQRAVIIVPPPPSASLGPSLRLTKGLIASVFWYGEGKTSVIAICSHAQILLVKDPKGFAVPASAIRTVREYSKLCSLGKVDYSALKNTFLQAATVPGKSRVAGGKMITIGGRMERYRGMALHNTLCLPFDRVLFLPNGLVDNQLPEIVGNPTVLPSKEKTVAWGKTSFKMKYGKKTYNVIYEKGVCQINPAKGK